MNPPTSIMSFFRSTMKKKPCSSIFAMSPVRSQPSFFITISVSSVRFPVP